DAEAALTPIATPTAPTAAGAARAGAPVSVGWSANLTQGQRFQVEASTNATATVAVVEDFESGRASRAFTTSGDQPWKIDASVGRDGGKSFNLSGLTSEQQSRLELTETITEPTEVAFTYNSGASDELSFFINRELQQAPSTGTDWRDFTTTLQPGTYTFTWLAAGKSRQKSPIAIDNFRIGSVSDAKWTPVATTAPGATQASWTPGGATADAGIRVRADNGRFQGDWVQGPSFAVADA
ncbi:MAG: hypothetical protein JWN72_2892, partial [Thermoleophilia bacterium]|nr:hypothetical protein [Thermoleophilia bacterium]